MRLGFIGAGNMASALARGIAEPVLVSDLDAARAEALANAVGGQALATNAEVAEQADAIVLCHKPKQLDEVAASLGGQARVVISILAATTTARIEEAYPGAPVYRFIPNIPAELGKGVLCYAPGSRAAAGPEQEILALMQHAGSVIRLEDEALIEPAMAIMSCGPAFYALLAEAFAEAGVAYGLDPANAARMSVETMAGAAASLSAHELDFAALRARVATPGGATERGLEALTAAGAHGVCRSAVDAVLKGIER